MWRDLLQTEEVIVLPWLGGRSLRNFERMWTIEGDLPPEHGFHAFQILGRKARFPSFEDRAARRSSESAPLGALRNIVKGYLIGDRLVPDDVQIRPDLAQLARGFERVHLIEPGLDRFARVAAGRFCESGPLVFESQEMPLGSEAEVLSAYLDGAESVDHIPGVFPALDAAFRVDVWRRQQAERRRRELEEQRQAEAEQRERQRRQQEVIRQFGDAAARRHMATFDFATAARASLALGGAEYIDHRPAYRRGEITVRFRFAGQRFACTCDANTLRIIDAGICLTDHETGEKGDELFTLESLPAVIREAEREGVLVVFRHMD